MKTIIIEDELIAAQNLERLLVEVDPEIEVARTLQSVEESVEYFSHTNDVELVFMDIHLADGLAFHIFDKVNIECPIIFTTAYDQYALDAFKVNSIDYLLKPIDKDGLTHALQKWGILCHQENADSFAEDHIPEHQINPEQLMALSQSMQQKKYKSYFLIPLRDKLIPLDVNDIAYIYLDGKTSRVVTLGNESHCIDKSLDAIHSQLDPTRFFRANRQFIIAHKAVESISLWPLNKLSVSLKVTTPEKIIISRARVAEFKEWYTE